MGKNDLRIVVAMARAYNDLFSRIEKHVRSHGLGISEFGVLELLLHKGDQPVQKIAEKILVTSGTMTYVIDKLVKKGWVLRRKCDKDGRVTYVSLTPEGRDLIEAVFADHKRFLECLFADLDEPSKERLIDSLNHMRGHLPT